MTKSEFVQWFEAQVQPRWSTWPVNTCIIGDWYEVFGRFNPESLTEAVRQHKIRDDSIRPKINAIRSILRSRTQGQGLKSSDPTPAFYVQCIEPPANRPNRVSKPIPIHMPPGSHDPEALATCAETIRQKHERLYGGRWMTVTGNLSCLSVNDKSQIVPIRT